MSNKESLVAADLFGDSSSGGDFFSSLQADPQPHSTSSNNTQPHSTVEPSRQFSQGPATLPTNAADLFGASDAGTSVDSLWGQAVDPSAVEHQEWPAQEQQHQQWPTTGYGDGQDPSAQQMGTYDYNGQDYAHDTANGYSYGEHDGYANYDANGLHQNYATSNASQTATTDYYPTYPSYDPPAQAAASAQYPTYPSSVSSDPYQPATTTYSQQQQSYDPYAPTTTSAYTPSGSQSTAPTSSTQSASSTHSATTSSRGLYPGVTYATDSSYDPYKPTGNAKAPPPTKPVIQAAPTTPYTPSYPSYPSYPAYSTPEAPPRPKPTQTAAEVYRSTSYNAYDPPILDRPRKAKAGHGSVLSPPPSASVPNYPAGPPPMGGRRTPVAAPPPPPRAHSPYYPAPAAPVPPPAQMAPVQPAYVPHQAQPPQQAHNLGYGPPPSNVQPPVRPYSAQAPQQIAHTTGGSQPGWGATTNLQTNGAINLEEDWYADEFPKDEPQALPQTQRAEICLDPEDAQTPHYDPYREEVGSELGRRSLDAYEPNGVDSFAAHKPAPAASTVEQHSAYDPYAPPRKASLTSISSHGSAPKPVHGSQPVGSTSPTMSAKSPRSVSGSVPTSPQDRHQVNGASPPVRYHQSSPTKAPPPPRTGTPGSVRSRIASPELSLKGRASPRPDAIIASEKIRAASPAAHLEAARSRIVHPETSAVKTGVAKPPPTKVSPTNGTAPYDPYKPRSGTLPSSERPVFTQLDGMIPRTASPYAAEPTDVGQTASYDPYSPQPNGHARRHTSESLSSTQYNPYGVSAVPAESVYTPRASMESTYSSSYLPSSTQTGGDDPLGRTNCRAPIITFGFGGKVVSSFAKQIDGSAGFDVSLISRRPPPVSVRPLKSIMMEEAPKFPGPLFSDPGTPTVNITRTAATTVKAKKALVLKYLEERAAEVEAEIGQLAPEIRSQRAGKLSLILVLKVMVENDGKVSGSPEIENAVRTALLPRLKDALDTSTYGFTSPAGNGLLVPGNPALGHTSTGDDRPVATYTVRSSVLDNIQEHLLRGEKRMAYRHALDERLWAHAMLIASSLDQDAWKETVGEFVRTELGVDPTRASSEPANGREALRVAYSLFAGHGASAVNELLPPKPLARTTNLNHSLIIPPSPLPPLTPAAVATGSYTVPHGPAPTESLAKWQEAAATIASNASNGDTAALTALGDLLSANKWANAAHVCYLLSLQTSHLGGAGSPASKVILVGSENPLLKPNFHVEDDPFIFSEVLEFAFSLVPTVKGQDAFNGIPHLQAYRLVQAFRLAEHGHISLATRYCEAIATTIRIGKPSPFYTRTFLEQLKDLSDRLSGTPQLDKTGSWIARKMTKPSLATLGNWIESGVTKFIAGEGDESASDPNSTKKPSGGSAAGPFAQFTVISSANTSPNASSANLSMMASPPMTGLAPPSTGPPRRTGSAMAVRGPFGMYGGLAPPDRASSAMDMRADPLSPMTPAGFQVLSANAATTFYEADSAYRGAADHAAASSMNASQSTDTERPSYGSWYDSGSQGDDATKNTSSATFYSVPAEGDAGGFISPMDSFSGGPTSRTTSHHSTPRSMSVAPVEEEDEEDLGFGNSSRKKKQAPKAEDGDAEDKKESKPAEKPAAPPPTSSSKPPSPTEAKANGGSWLPWKWGKKEEPSTPGPVKAKLGEESTFYYDKELKRWVNKKAGETSAAPAPLPPPPSRAPSRAQTASPSQMAPTTTSSLSRGATPPPRPQSSALASASTLKPLTSVVPPRRSHLAESYVPSPETSTPPTPTTDGGPTRSRIIDPDLVPPPSRASNSSKRKGKSRYIDVFQQEQGGAAS